MWSCGGAIAEWARCGDATTVVNVFDGDPARRAEDSAAFDGWPVARSGLGLADAVGRRADGAPLYRSPLALRRRPHPADAWLAEVLIAALRPIVAGADHVYAPIGHGAHVDHVLVRLAADAVVGPGRLCLYAEFPYRVAPPRELVRVDATVDFTPWLGGGLAYRSQVAAMFGGPLAFARTLARHARLRPDGTSRWPHWRSAPANAPV